MDTSSSIKSTISSVSQHSQLHTDSDAESKPNPIPSFVLIRKRSFQKVRFAPLVGRGAETDSNTVFASPHQELTEDLIQATWYSKKELISFQQKATLIMLLKQKYPNLAEESKYNESVMGLDRFDPKRSAYKRAAMNFTLQAQQKNPDFLAAVARQCSSWARSAAIHQALVNYRDAYRSKNGKLCAKVKLMLQNHQSSLLATNHNNKGHHADGTKRSFEGADPLQPAQQRRRVTRSA